MGSMGGGGGGGDTGSSADPYGAAGTALGKGIAGLKGSGSGAGDAGSAVGSSGTAASAGSGADISGGGLSAGDAAASLSDITKKDNVAPADKQMKDLMTNLDPASWDYKQPEKFGQGKHFGIIAQDLEKSEAGRTAIINTPEGKMVDMVKLSAMNAASNAILYKQLEKQQRILDRLDKKFRGK